MNAENACLHKYTPQSYVKHLKALLSSSNSDFTLTQIYDSEQILIECYLIIT